MKGIKKFMERRGLQLNQLEAKDSRSEENSS